MPPYKTLKRCHLPDLDVTIPVSREITWGRPLTQQEIDNMRAWSQADAGVNEVKSKATIERMNAVFGAQHDFRLYIEFKWHKMVMRLLEHEWHRLYEATSESMNAVFGAQHGKKDKDV